MTGTRAGVLFDVDGTLLDTNYLHVIAWTRAFRRCGYQPAMSDIHAAIGIASAGLIEYVIDAEDEKVSDAHSELYDELTDEIKPFPRAGELLEHCARAGLAVVLATSGREEDLEWMLPAIGVDEDLLTGAVTSGDVAQAKPAPDLLLTPLEKYDLDPGRTVVVGDTVWDVKAAVRAGLPCIGLTCGGISERDLRAEGAIEVYADPAALLEAFDSSRLGSLH